MSFTFKGELKFKPNVASFVIYTLLLQYNYKRLLLIPMTRDRPMIRLMTVR